MTYTPDYLYPVTVHSISDDFADHVARGSVNPGTDYEAPYGSPIIAVADGYVAGVVTTNYGSGGRMVYVDHDDGLGTDYLHLSLIAPGIVNGKRVFRGDLLGYSGASGYGEDRYYGPHLHISIRNVHGWHAMNHGNFDFDAFIRGQAATAGGNATPIPSTPTLPVTRKVEDMYLYKQTQGSMVTYILWIPSKAKYQTTTDVAQANKWSELVGYSAREISSAAVSELFDNIRVLFA